MPRLDVPVPVALERTIFDTEIPAEYAVQLDHLDLADRPGRIVRGRGFQRSSDIAATAATVLSAGVFTRRDCRKLLVDCLDTGTLRAHTGDGLRVAGPPCVGPQPDCMDGQPDDLEAAKECDGCVAFSEEAGAAPWDIDVTIENADVKAGLAHTIQNVPGERIVRPCVGSACANYVDQAAHVNVRVTNNSDYCVRGQVYFDISGLPCDCELAWKAKAAEAWATNGNARQKAWWFFCVEEAGNMTLRIKHAIQTAGYCAGLNARIHNWLVDFRCSNGGADGDCSGDYEMSGCAACP